MLIKLYLYHVLQQQVIIESDGDLRTALVSFLELSQANSAVHLRTVHIEECVEVMMLRDEHAEPLELWKCSNNDGDGQPQKKARKV